MKFIALSFTALLIAACSSTPKEEPKEAAAPTMSMEAKQVAIEQEAPNVAEITFKKGSSQLSTEAKSQLKKLLQSAGKMGTLEEVKVVSWSDREYPGEKGKELPSADMKLADQRNRAIEKYFKDQSRNIKITAYSMAQAPSQFSEWLGSEESRIKESLEDSGIPTSQKKQDTPKASRAIIMIQTKATKR